MKAIAFFVHFCDFSMKEFITVENKGGVLCFTPLFVEDHSDLSVDIPTR